MLLCFAQASSGSTLLEVGLLALLIAALALVAVTALGGHASNGFALADAEIPAGIPPGE
jgi:Flp pilus assembly pilin Flp